jgi:hypothetical protein
MPTLTWKDHRLPANDIAPWDTTVMFIGPGSTIAELVKDTEDWCKSREGVDKHLMIYCHGSPAYLQICKEGLYTHTLSKLSPLKPYFDDVSIHACLIAKGAAGRAFCVKMAQVLVAPVDGAVQLQVNTGMANIYGFLDDKKYDGEYYSHLPSGERQGPMSSDIPAIIHPPLY